MTTPETIEAVTKGAADSVVASAPYKPDDKITFRITSAEKVDMKAVAEQLGLSVTDYILRLHRAAKILVEGAE